MPQRITHSMLKYYNNKKFSTEKNTNSIVSVSIQQNYLSTCQFEMRILYINKHTCTDLNAVRKGTIT